MAEQWGELIHARLLLNSVSCEATTVALLKRGLSPGNTHDSKEFDKLLPIKRTKDNIKTLGEVYADSAYTNK